MAKEAINRAFETPLSEGMNVERNLFHSTFALEDRAEAWRRSSRSASR
jgi:enoyl-CoA hydratase